MDPLPAPQRPDGPRRVVVHSSLWGLLTGVLGPGALVALAAAAIAAGGLRPLPTTILAAGIVLGLVVLLDLPRHAVLDRAGITRVCWLRRHRLPWSQVVAIERTRPSTVAVTRNAMRREGPHEGAQVSGGLVARGRGKRRWLLTDRVESRAEHDQLRALLDAVPHPVALRAATPHEGAPPTDLYRRRRPEA